MSHQALGWLANLLRIASVGLVGWVAGCRGKSEPAMHSGVSQEVPSAQNGCAHAACGDDYLIDVIAPESCTIGTPCRLAIQLVATGVYHINDDYPYKFRADDTPGVDFLGTDPTGQNVFSKTAGNWTKSSLTTGTMVVTYKPADTQAKTVGGVLKFSVCSPQNCEVEHRQVNASVQAKR